MNINSAANLIISCTFAFAAAPLFAASLKSSDTYRAWQAKIAQAAEKRWTPERGFVLKAYTEAANEIPEEATITEKVKLWMNLGEISRSLELKGAKDFYLKAETLLEKVPTCEKDILYDNIYIALAEFSSGNEAIQFANKASKFAESLYGRKIQLAPYLVLNASTAYANNDKNLAANLIEQSLKLCADADIDDRRLEETKVLSRIAEYYKNTKRFAEAELYYKKAIYAGESLWYPLYGWSRCAMFSYIRMLDLTGRDKEAGKQRERLVNIQTTGHDPEGRDVCKYWNGLNSPDAGPQCSVSSSRNFHMHETKRTPREIYQKPAEN